MIAIHGPRQSGKTEWLYRKWLQNPETAIVFPSTMQKNYFISHYKIRQSAWNYLGSWANLDWLRGRDIKRVMVDNIDMILQAQLPEVISYTTFTGPAHALEIPEAESEFDKLADREQEAYEAEKD